MDDLPEFIKNRNVTKHDCEKIRRKKRILGKYRRYKERNDLSLDELLHNLSELRTQSKRDKISDEFLKFEYHRAIIKYFLNIRLKDIYWLEVKGNKPEYDEKVVSILNIIGELENTIGFSDSKKLHTISQDFTRGLIVEGLIIYGLPRKPAIVACAKWMKYGESTVRTSNENVRRQYSKLIKEGKFDTYHFPYFLKFQGVGTSILEILQECENKFPFESHVKCRKAYTKFRQALENIA